MPEPPGQDKGTKRERVKRGFVALSDADLPVVAERILIGQLPVDASQGIHEAPEEDLA